MSLPTAEPSTETVNNETKSDANIATTTNVDNDNSAKSEKTKSPEPATSLESTEKVATTEKTTNEENVSDKPKDDDTKSDEIVTDETKINASTDDLDGKLNLASAADNASGDTLFEPSLEMMVNDFDDERTLEEEEALAATESQDPSAELSNLERVCI